MRKLLYLLFLAGAAGLATFRGGSVPRLLFGFALLLPVFSLLYSLCVYFSLRLVQETARSVVKGQEVPYRLTAANEGPLPFLRISLLFHTDRVFLKDAAETVTVSLLPRETLHSDIRMYCRHRGTYPVGVRKVFISDFLGLFTIPFPFRSQVRLTARPRILPLEQLQLTLQQQDPKNNRFSHSRPQELPDFELRAYQPGDAPKYIHWKSSARTGELLVRRQMPEELAQTAVILDLTPPAGSTEEERLQAEDNILETALAYLHDSYRKQLPACAVWQEKELVVTPLRPGGGFGGIYDKCSNLIFRSKKSLEEVWTEFLLHRTAACSCILITSRICGSLQDCVAQRCRLGYEVMLINAGELPL